MDLDESRTATAMTLLGSNQPPIFIVPIYILHLPFWDSSAQENLLGGLDTWPLRVLGGDEFSNEVGGVALLGWSPIYIQENKDIKNVKKCRDGMPKNMQTR